MIKVYTQIGAGNAATAHLTPKLQDAVASTSLGRISEGALVQCNMAYGIEGVKFGTTEAENILELAEHHAVSMDTAFTVDGQQYTTAGYRRVVQKSLAHTKGPIAGGFVNYEVHDAPDPLLRFDASRRRNTLAEFELMGQCVTTLRVEMFRATGKILPCGWWNAPIEPLAREIDWGWVRELHCACGTNFAFLNSYRVEDDADANYEVLMQKAELMKRELPGIQIIATLMPSADGKRFVQVPTDAIDRKMDAIKEAGIDTLWWVNASWAESNANAQSIVGHANRVANELLSTTIAGNINTDAQAGGHTQADG